MSCLECLHEKKKIDCRKCNMPFVERDIHFCQDEEEQELEFFKGVMTVGIAVAIVLIVAIAIYWWAGL